MNFNPFAHFKRQQAPPVIDPDWRSNEIAKVIDEVCKIEAHIEWLERMTADSNDRYLPALSQLIAPTKLMLFGTSAQLTADIYDESETILARPRYAVNDQPEQDTPAYYLTILTALSKRTKAVLNHLSNVTEWEGRFYEELNAELVAKAPGKLKAAWLQIENCKSALAVTVAGYDYMDKFNSDGEPIMPPITDYHTGGYV